MVVKSGVIQYHEGGILDGRRFHVKEDQAQSVRCAHGAGSCQAFNFETPVDIRLGVFFGLLGDLERTNDNVWVLSVVIRFVANNPDLIDAARYQPMFVGLIGR